jgi:hypothetical protein
VKLSKDKPTVQTFLDGHMVKPQKAKPKVHRKKEHPILFPAQNNPSNLMAKILSMFDFFMEKKGWPLDHSLGFYSRLTQTSFEIPLPW